MDDYVSVIGDWLPPNPNRIAILPYSIAECHDSKSILDNSFLKPAVGVLQELKESKNHEWEPSIQASVELPIESDCLSFSRSSSRSGLAERIAGKAGFGNLTLDTSYISKTASFPSSMVNACSPLLTIPPGLSPTMLLDSPIFLSNTMPALDVHQQSISIQRTSIQSPLQAILHHEFSNPSNGKANSGDALLDRKALNTNTGNDHLALLDEPQEGELSSGSLGTASQDGYSWRKYGQKQVKGSEYPRSYYKCTYPNCPVKKKVECSHVGRVTEIVYKGVHNHLKPPTSRRTDFPSSQSANEMQIDVSEINWATDLDWKNDGTDANQSTSASIEQSNQFGTLQAHDVRDPGGMDASSTLSNDDGVEEDQATHGSVTFGTEGDGDEPESKRRKLDACALEMSSGSRSIREPRVVVQTTSDVDILDDGYRWRKYGQKVVKGNPNPRSYYKCTNPGCSVRKHVERASHDLKSVITTYEGKHNHEVPAARASGNQTNSPLNSSIVTTTAPSSLPQKAEPARMPDALGKLNVPRPLGCFGFHAMIGQQLGNAGPSFFAMSQQSLLQNFAMAGLGQMAPLKMPVLPRLPAYMPQHRQGSSSGFVMPMGVVPLEESAAEAASPKSGGSAAYNQLVKMRLGHQI